ncbi:hypothetical protein [Streptomyces corynorhini]|uniref:Uncharacterized protein n=1 Tax=Streptomyces corynorhini TaxID=2282652 RepID=A0A370B1B4_9ACTN|nr:hypothetical protein [Streptomyces corynorhini]RDG35687.1 hypothetical protein DVH02_23970 [Streptomyces corynorhini]
MTYCSDDNHVHLGDGLGVWCEKQGVTILFRGAPLTSADVPPEDGVRAPCAPCFAADIFGLVSPHRCTGTLDDREFGHVSALPDARPCPCDCGSADGS